MKTALVIACLALAAPALAETEPRPSLAVVMEGATTMAAIGSSYLFVTKPDSAWVCAINANPKHFAALIAGDKVVVEQTVPGTICVPASHFKNLAE